MGEKEEKEEGGKQILSEKIKKIGENKKLGSPYLFQRGPEVDLRKCTEGQ
jgi:hypothetical protein